MNFSEQKEKLMKRKEEVDKGHEVRFWQKKKDFVIRSVCVRKVCRTLHKKRTGQSLFF